MKTVQQTGGTGKIWQIQDHETVKSAIVPGAKQPQNADKCSGNTGRENASAYPRCGRDAICIKVQGCCNIQGGWRTGSAIRSYQRSKDRKTTDDWRCLGL